MEGARADDEYPRSFFKQHGWRNALNFSGSSANDFPVSTRNIQPCSVKFPRNLAACWGVRFRKEWDRGPNRPSVLIESIPAPTVGQPPTPLTRPLPERNTRQCGQAK